MAFFTGPLAQFWQLSDVSEIISKQNLSLDREKRHSFPGA